MPAIYIAKYNRFVDNILVRMNKILRKSYDPVSVRLQPVDAKKKSKKSKSKKSKSGKKKNSRRNRRKNSHKRSMSDNVAAHRTDEEIILNDSAINSTEVSQVYESPVQNVSIIRISTIKAEEAPTTSTTPIPPSSSVSAETSPKTTTTQTTPAPEVTKTTGSTAASTARSATTQLASTTTEKIAPIVIQNSVPNVVTTTVTSTGNRATNESSIKKKGKKKRKNNKGKQNNKKSKPRARGTLYGLSSLRRNGDVIVNIMADYTTVKTDFLIGPLILKVEKEFGRGAKKELKSATATTAEMIGKLNMRVPNGGGATLHSIRVLQPKQVRVESADNHDRTREFIWSRSSDIAHIVSKELTSVTRSILKK